MRNKVDRSSSSNSDREQQVLLIVRHAHRDKKVGRDIDNGLSSKGNQQAKNIKNFYERKFDNQKPIILSSPKRRCLETVERIAKKTKVIVEVSDLLDEDGDIAQKVGDLISKIQGYRQSPIVVCSHGDVIPSLISSLVHADVELDKGGVIQINKLNGEYQIKNLIQDFDSIC